ncbi:MAG: putative oxidoreductase/dehydrogenase protein [Devosia sp.]|nr:Gfo/Idh/MocA family oxidoreductase [Devosia sp.]MDB5527122.1 putative oxidoreductase/dehydrogenase protein [Devosia sp.]
MIGGGRGAFFASYHRAAMRIANRFDLVAGAFSSDPAVAMEAGEALDIAPDRIYPSFTDMVAKEAGRSDRIDVGIVVTPNHLHFEPCRLLLEAGIPVICDKPLVNSTDEARELVRIAEKSNTFFALTYTYLGYPMVRDARARIAAGELGEIRFMYVEYLCEWLANDPSKLGKGGVWRGDPLKAGPTGALGDIGTHAFNILEFLSGKKCTALNAKLTTVVPGWGMDDTDVLQLEFEGGIDGLLWSSIAAPGHRNGLRFKIVGTKATAEWCQEAPETLLFSRLGLADLVYRRGGGDMTEDGRDSVNLPAGNPESYLEALATLYADFAQALEAGPDWRNATAVPLPDIRQGLRGVALSEVAVQSNKQRAWVAFPDE